MIKTRTLPEIRIEGLQALLERLGPADTARFLQQYSAGHGDYTKERGEWLDRTSLDDLVEGIERRRTT